MEKRLKLAKNLLKPDGVLYISIGNDELAQLKMLCDEIFGEFNLVEVISRVAKTASNKGTQFSPSVDYLLCYTKDLQKLGKFKDIVTDDWLKLFNKEDKRGKYREISLYQAALDVRPNQNYFIICPDGSKARPPEGKVYRWTEKTLLENLKDDKVVFKKAKNSPLLDEKGKKSIWNIYTKTYLSDREEEGKRPRNFLDEFINRRGADLLSEMGIEFNYSKPVNLIKYLIQITNKLNDITVLDFFAGSGTTGHAVLEINGEDSGNRQFILCTNNEDNNGSGLKIASDICYPRIKKAVKGYKNTKGENVAGLGGNLKYYVCDFVEAAPTDRNKRKLVSESTEMLCIRENAFELVHDENDFKIFKNSDEYLGIIFYEEAIGDFKKAIKKIKGHFNTYVFSLGDDPHEKQFADVKEKVTLCAIPEVILKVYREIFK
jgi:adenine-specific DNA-methyltransferase